MNQTVGFESDSIKIRKRSYEKVLEVISDQLIVSHDNYGKGQCNRKKQGRKGQYPALGPCGHKVSSL